MKIKLCENKAEGHHSLYFNSLLKIEGTYLKISNQKIEIKFLKNPIKYILNVRKLIKDYIDFPKKEIVHFLNIDCLYFYCGNLRKNKYIGTLHQIPRNKIKRFFLKKFVGKLKYVIVHSKFLKKELEEIGVKNIRVINYPSFYEYKNLDREKIKKMLEIPKNKIVLSCLGETRKNKGINILVESINYLDLNIKEKILVNIAGKEVYYKRDEIIKMGNIVRVNLNLLSEKEFIENIVVTDIMVMPYLKNFGGNSGPMTEAIVNKIPCITPKELNIGKINLKNNLGEVFECENPKSLAKAIERTIENLNKGIYYNTDFYKQLTEEKFLEEYRKIYEEVWSELENE